MQFIEYVNKTLLLKSQLRKILTANDRWTIVLNFLKENEPRFNYFKTVSKEVDKQLNDYRTGRDKLDREEIKQFHDHLNETNSGLQKIEPFISLKKPSLEIDLEDELSPSKLFKEWDAKVNYARNDMTIDSIESTYIDMKHLWDTAEILSIANLEYKNNKELFGSYKGVLEDLISRFGVCSRIQDSKNLKETIRTTVSLLLELAESEKKFNGMRAKLEEGKFNCKSLLNRWASNMKVIKSSMNLDRTEESVNICLELIASAKLLVFTKSSINENIEKLSVFKALERELERDLNSCITQGQSKELAVKLSNILEGINKNILLQKKFIKYGSICSDEDKKIIQELFDEVHNRVVSDQLNNYNYKLESLISSIPVKDKNRKVLITKVIIGSVAFIIFTVLMTIYVVPFFDEINSTFNSEGYFIWIVPVVLAIFIGLYKKKIIFKNYE